MSAAVDFDSTRKVQWGASDPAASAWVVANAGSGKTHVLTQRVIRLLLAGADPASILCLTYTKIAAAEMTRRIFEHLGAWATLPDPQLHQAIRELQERAPSAAETRAARRLFARALETPGGLKIQTIHAFCEKLLHQFPFEANVPGQFTVLDDTAAAALLAEARAAVLAAASADPESRLAKAVRYMAEHASDTQIEAALDAVIGARQALHAWRERLGPEGATGSIDDALADLRKRLGLAAQETEEALCASICKAARWAGVDCKDLTDALQEAASGHSYDERAQTALAGILQAGDPRAEALARITFFTTWKEGGFVPRLNSQRFGPAFRASRPDLDPAFGEEAERLVALAGKLTAARSVAATEALLVVGDAILTRYAQAKRSAGQLDFADLVVKARNLLSRAEAAAWVLYKLDRRIDHILVDEAQDTSPDQWAIIRALAADFFAGETAAGAERTVFSVGDDKQSIFGFQGAAPQMLAEMARFFEGLVQGAGRRFVRAPLQLSFRSTIEILDGVDTVFRGDPGGRITSFGYQAHSARYPNVPGRVVVMPRRVREKAEEPEDWREPYDAPTAADKALADDVALEVKALIGTPLPSGKVVTPGGILILGRKRDAFFAAVNRKLREAGVPIAGADRLPVASHIAVLDLLALADVMLLPEDDLQLAALLKSPLIGLSEDELMRLALERSGSLWDALAGAGEPRIAAAATRLARWRSAADILTPFRFLATVLGPDGGRRSFRERLGGEADDVLDALLSQALAYERLGPPTLQGFAAFIRAGEGEVKREAGEASAGVRVMTVHGAKGLEADVVFLVDTGGQIVVPGHRPCLVNVGGAGTPAFLWRRSKEDATEAQREADRAADIQTEDEYLRLLYVAMTRARDVLYVCGIRGERTPPGCWYRRVAEALVPAEARDGEGGELPAPYVWPQPQRTPAPPAEAEGPAAEPAPVLMPDWLSRPAPPAPEAPQPLRPSRALGEPDPRAAGDAAPDLRSLMGATGFVRGRLVHKLLQLLPGLPDTARGEAAARLIGRELPGAPETAAALRREVEAVLAAPDLARFFGPGSRGEAPVAGELATRRGPYAVSGRIDRLVRDAAGWGLLDFKTDRGVPASPEAVDPAYIRQLALYARLVADMEPGVPVQAFLCWTAGPNLMPVPPQILERALAELGIGESAVA